jgi:hypothetical protein
LAGVDGAAWLAAVALLLTGCAREPTLAEREAADARAVAQVEAVQKQKPPPRPIFPQPIGFDEIQARNLYGAGCAFTPDGGSGPVLLTRDKAGYVRLGDRLIRLASDPGSTSMPLGTWSRYIGKEFVAALANADSGGEPLGSESLRWTGRLTMTDAFDQPIYAAEGMLACGS